MLRSGDDQTLLMIAAASSDKMTFKACVEALRLAVTPHDVRTRPKPILETPCPWPVPRLLLIVGFSSIEVHTKTLSC